MTKTSATKLRTPYQPHAMLVTGGAGFIGVNFIRQVLEHEPDIHIVNVDKLTYAGSLRYLEHLPHRERHHFVQADILDTALMKHILQHHHIDTIVHFAAETHVDRSISDPAAFVQTNVNGTFSLLAAARHHWFEVEGCLPEACRFHHISTDEVYGSLNHDDPPFTEQTPYCPRSPYAASKAGADHLVRAYHHTYGLPITISHCSNNFGPFQHPEKFIPTIIHACLHGTPIPIYGDGKNIRDWLYVDDHCRGVMQIIKHGTVGESYNLGSRNEWRNIELAKNICALMDQVHPGKSPYHSLIQSVSDRPGHDFRYAMDSQKAQRWLGWQAQEALTAGLHKTIAFYLKSHASA